MGGGNAQKSEIARQRNAARAAANAGGNSQLGQKEKAMSIKCKICKQAFMCTQNEQDLLNHISGKHAKNSWDDCFDPVFVAVPNSATVYKGRGKAHAALGTDNKKGYPKDANIEEFDTKEAAVQHIINAVSYINDEEGVTYEE